MSTPHPVSLRHYSSKRALLRQWAGVLAGPLAWLAHFQANYALVQHACGSESTLTLHIVSLVAFLIAAAGAAMAVQTLRSGGGRPAAADRGGPVERSRLMGTLGLAASGLFALVIVAQWLPLLLIDPCVR